MKTTITIDKELRLILNQMKYDRNMKTINALVWSLVKEESLNKEEASKNGNR